MCVVVLHALLHGEVDNGEDGQATKEQNGERSHDTRADEQAEVVAGGLDCAKMHGCDLVATVGKRMHCGALGQNDVKLVTRHPLCSANVQQRRHDCEKKEERHVWRYQASFASSCVYKTNIKDADLNSL